MAPIPASDPTPQGPLPARPRMGRETAPGDLVLIHVGNRVDPVLMRDWRARAGRPGLADRPPQPHRGAKRPAADDPARLLQRRRQRGADGVEGRRASQPRLVPQRGREPAVELWAAGRGGRTRARGRGDEYERLWELASAMYDGYDKYQELCADRRIPLIVCEPDE